MDNAKFKLKIETVTKTFRSCLATGPPAPSRTISFNHVNEWFNDEIQVNFRYFSDLGNAHAALHLVSTGTGFSEVIVVKSLRAYNMVEDLQVMCIYTHVRHKCQSADY